MSLQLAAQHMASRGRGPDTQLVHMAPQEVAGLQALAKAHGGSLTTNPDTGLPEAGFLSSILPMVAGAFLGPAGLGLTAMQSGLAAGALGTLATGSLKKGLMAGLGAYGGAGLAGSIMGSGTGAISAGTGADVAAAAGNTGLIPAAQVAPAAQMVPSVQGVQVGAPIIDSANLSQTGANLFGPSVPTPNLSGATSGYEQGMPIKAANMVPTVTPAPMSDPTIVSEATQERLLADRLAKATPMDKAKAGLGELFKDPKRFLTKDNLMYAGAAAAPLLFQEQKPQARKEEKPYEYSFDYGRVANPYANRSGAQTGEVMHFNPVYTRKAADGGLMGSGPVQSMSDQNQAEMLMINRGQRYAEGGETKAVAPVEDNPFYTMTGQSGDAFKYLMGQGPRVTAAPAAAPAAATELVVTPASVANATGDAANNYIFNPSTGAFTPLSAAATAARSVVPVPVSSGNGSYAAGPSAWDNMTLAEKAAYYDANPKMAAVTQFGQNLFGKTALGELSEYLNPQAYGEAQAVAKGFDPSQTSFGRGAGSLFGLFGSGLEATPKEGVDVYGYAPVGLNTGAPAVDPDAPSTFNPVPSSGYGGINYSSPSANTYSYDPSQSYGGGDTTSPSSADTTAADNSGIGGWATGGLAALAAGGQSHLGDYSDGGRLLRGPGDGVSDSIPAVIGKKRPARLADGEFVVPARIVSELGNGSTEAGARKLYAMMDRVQKARKKSIGKNRVAVNSKTDKLLPA